MIPALPTRVRSSRESTAWSRLASGSLKKKIARTATEEQLAMLKKYSVQKKHFVQELRVDDIMTVLKKRRAVINVCSMLTLSPEERDDYFVIDTDSRM